MTGRTLPREPWRGSQICGWQIAYGLPWDKFCAERKAESLPVCEKHWYELIADDESTRFPSSVARGDRSQAVRLLWEPSEGDVPVEPSYDEMARYAGASPLGGE